MEYYGRHGRAWPGHPRNQSVGLVGGWVYIMTNKPNGILYVGVTSDLPRRIFEHREGIIEGFTKRFGLKRLVHAEFHKEIELAIQREKTIKH